MLQKLIVIILMAMVHMIGIKLPELNAAYPDRPIRVLVAYPAGGGTDVSIRLLCRHAEKYVGASLEVENIPGAGGEKGFTALAKARPDGYTIGGINTMPVISLPIERTREFTLDSFEPIVMVMDDPNIWAVRADSPYKSLKDIVDKCKDYGKPIVTIGTSGIGGDDHIAILQFDYLTGIELVHVPLQGGAPARAALLGGHITLWGGNLGEALPMFETGKIRILGVMAKERHPLSLSIKTFAEQGYPIFMESTRGLAAPKGIARDRMNYLINTFSKAMKDTKFLAEAKMLGLPLGQETGEEYGQRLRHLQAICLDLWKKHPWK